MKKPVRIILTVLLALVFLFSITQFLGQRREDAAADSAYADALALATSGSRKPSEAPTDAAPETVPAAEPQWVVAPIEEEDPHIQELEALDLEALRQVNPQVVGWIRIPDSPIDYPLMQGEDNEYYLKYTWDGKRYAAGSIFLECYSDPELTDFNTIVYGHNMNSGSMFASIRTYRNQKYWEAHPYVYIRSDLGVYRYEIFSSYLADVEGYTYGIQFSDEEAQENFLASCLHDSVIQTGIQPEPTDRILTLSTCSGRGYTTRWVAHARLKMVLEQP